MRSTECRYSAVEIPIYNMFDFHSHNSYYAPPLIGGGIKR